MLRKVPHCLPPILHVFVLVLVEELPVVVLVVPERGHQQHGGQDQQPHVRAVLHSLQMAGVM